MAGGAGSGKSAVLGRLVTLADSRFCREYHQQVANIPADLLPPVECVDAALIAKGRLPDETLTELLTALQVPATIGAGTPTRRQQLQTWSTWLAGQGRPITVVVDAVDESANPAELIDGVLHGLLEGPNREWVRLIVGIRSPSHREPEINRGRQPEGLADRASRALQATQLNVDGPPWWCQDDLAGFAAEILITAPASPYHGKLGLAESIARNLARHASRSFLVTRLAATALAARGGVVDPRESEWLKSVDEGVVGVFRADLQQTLPDPADRLRAVHLMRALAFSYGRGLPWNKIWPTVATAVADDSDWYGPKSPPSYGDNDIVWLLGTRLAAYLVTDREDETAVYRMYHQTLTDLLRDRWTQLLALPRNSQPTTHPMTTRSETPNT